MSAMPLDAQWTELMHRNIVGAGTDRQFSFIYVADVSLEIENALFGFDPSLSKDQLTSTLKPGSQDFSPPWLQANWPPPEARFNVEPLALALWRIKAALGIRNETQGKSLKEIEAAPLTVLSGLEGDLRNAQAYRSFRASVVIDMYNPEAITWGFGSIVRKGLPLPTSKKTSKGVPAEELFYQLLLRAEVSRQLERLSSDGQAMY
jgi:hypothetical protein